MLWDCEQVAAVPVRDSTRPESDANGSAANAATASDAQPTADQRLAAIDAELQPEAAVHVKVRWLCSSRGHQACCHYTVQAL